MKLNTHKASKLFLNIKRAAKRALGGLGLPKSDEGVGLKPLNGMLWSNWPSNNVQPSLDGENRATKRLFFHRLQWSKTPVLNASNSRQVMRRNEILSVKLKRSIAKAEAVKRGLLSGTRAVVAS